MTVDTEVSSIRYTGIIDGTPVAAPFPVQATDEIVVYYNSDQVALLGTHYTVTLDPPDYLTATVTPITGFAVLSGGVITIDREIPYLQPNDIPAHATLASSALEGTLDRSVFMSQQLRDQLARALKYAHTDSVAAFGTLPLLNMRAGKLLGFDAGGLPIAYDPGPGSYAPRIRLPGPISFYIRPGGSDANNGLSNVDSGAFQTLQGAYNYVKYNVDCMGYRPSMRVADGTYSQQLVAGGALVGEGQSPPIEFIGNVTSPQNVLISVTSGDAFALQGARIRLAGMKITTAGGSGSLLRIYDGSFVYHHDLWLADSGHESIECHIGSSCFAEGPTRVSGAMDSWCHVTENAQISFSRQTVNLDTVDPPRAKNYIFGLNRADCSMAGATVTGTFVSDGTYQSRIFVHIGGRLDVSSCAGVEGFFPGQVAPQIEAGGIMVYNQGDQYTIFCRTTAHSNNADGYADTDARAFLTPAAAMTALAKRPPDQILVFPGPDFLPVIKVGHGTWGNIQLIDLPQYPEAILLGDETTPSNCLISTTTANCIDANNKQTKWHVRGFKLVSTSGGGLVLPPRGNVAFQNCEVGACGQAQIQVNYDAYIEDTGPWKISGAAPYILLGQACRARFTQAVTVSGTPAFSSAAVKLDVGASVRMTGTFTGSATGVRTDLSTNSVLDLNGAGQASLPGNSNGTPDTGAMIV